jgi:hypothetical protein
VESLAGVVSSGAGEQVFMEEYLVHFVEIARKNGRSEFSEGDSRISVRHQSSQRSKGDTVMYSLKVKAQEGQDHISEPRGSSDLHADTCIGVSWVEVP